MPKKGTSLMKNRQLAQARMGITTRLGQPGPRADPYPPPGEWTPARAGKLPLPQTLEPPKKRMRRSVPLADVGNKMATREEKKWAAVVRACSLRASCAAAHKLCPRREMKDIAASINVGVRTLDRLINMALSTGSLARKPASGRVSSVALPVLRTWFRDASRRLGDSWTLRRMTAEVRKKWPRFGSPATVLRIAKKLGYKRVRMRTLPLLTSETRNKRKAWAESLLEKKHGPFGSGETVVIHVDEKWYYGLRQRAFFWVPPGELAPVVNISSRSHVNKVMLLGAVARPNTGRGFDGKIGLYPVVKPYRAKRNSANHSAGDVYDKPASLDAKLFRRMLKRVIRDAVLKTGNWAKKIIIQMDNAGGHGGGRCDINKTTLAKMRRFLEKHEKELIDLCPGRGTPLDIRFVAQPPSSPDLNVLDLGAWNSIQVAVEKLRESRTLSEPKEKEILDACFSAWERWDGYEKLGKLFVVLEKILVIVKAIEGGNKYEIPH